MDAAGETGELVFGRRASPQRTVEPVVSLTAAAPAQEMAQAGLLPSSEGAAEQLPMFFASPEQANALQDRTGDNEGGVYLPVRKSAAGKFTMPLYAAPGAAIATPGEQVERIVHLRTDRARRIYIAGPMTGLPEYNFPLFNAVAANLRAAGWHVENPAEHGHIADAGWDDYLRWDISRIATCGSLWLLPGWSNSKGATLEVHIAKTLGMQIEYGEGAELQEAPVASGEN